MKYTITVECESLAELQEFLGQRGTIGTKIVPAKIAVRKAKAFTEYELNFVRDYYGKKSTDWIASSLHRTKEQIYQLVFKMNKLNPDLKLRAKQRVKDIK